MTGIETSLGLMLTHMVGEGVIGWDRLIELMAVNPRAILCDERVAIEPGCVADLTVINPDAAWTVSKEDFCSKAQNTPFIGWNLRGRATDVYVGGYATMEDGQVISTVKH